MFSKPRRPASPSNDAPLDQGKDAEAEKEIERILLENAEKTRKSMIERLANWEDQKTWDEFYKRYWRLIYSVALKSGLRTEEAHDVVQETILTVAKQQKEQRYDPKAGSFKSWLLQQTRWRIGDSFRKRKKDTATTSPGWESDDRTTGTLDRFADPEGNHLEQLWDLEWKKSLTDRALASVKLRVSPKQYQIFDCYVVKGWDVSQVRKELGVSLAQVYLAKHRVGALVKKELLALSDKLH
jgi:RNA polymerase sigma factor (sigma-70 family)